MPSWPKKLKNVIQVTFLVMVKRGKPEQYAEVKWGVKELKGMRILAYTIQEERTS